MIAVEIDPPAVFERTAVSNLTGHPDDGAFAFVLLTRYRRLLPERLRRIAAALPGAAEEEARNAAMDAVLSLKVASSTVGAHELAGIAARVERLLRLGDVTQAVLVETTLAAAAARADHAIDAFLAG
ncbi:Hpt domain-containing protein [Nocardioides aquiterrae]|uniref:HPt domain-containing protein n=1 Tax=Nocardioides aquiterrae TaxID=203799 RepID=A0ABN1UER0_9ACTN